MGNVCNGLKRPYAPQRRATTCLEITQDDQIIKITCQTFYVEGVARTKNLDTQRLGYLKDRQFILLRFLVRSHYPSEMMDQHKTGSIGVFFSIHPKMTNFMPVLLIFTKAEISDRKWQKSAQPF